MQCVSLARPSSNALDPQATNRSLGVPHLERRRSIFFHKEMSHPSARISLQQRHAHPLANLLQRQPQPFNLLPRIQAQSQPRRCRGVVQRKWEDTQQDARVDRDCGGRAKDVQDARASSGVFTEVEGVEGAEENG